MRIQFANGYSLVLFPVFIGYHCNSGCSPPPDLQALSHEAMEYFVSLAVSEQL